ncbi:hypothetical protein UFOVP1533_48 [uncultured Caudovirales phage]|uniref:Uncharacterized protein n=1 Tax=uncultured Caudovirales phage TaxID=2100421 RepID=A0A6J5SFH4_9CAUD|nr:hypothetical protein UFOVP1086_48 [uncultured Caudovirales phage]CAB4212992.1 hypothetical protein UFOVP1440_48 [uncultured Caudovirales phage]CAB5228359.1 hypothetical protein UFOVP1533_48 [uncultured Caudovirales phage]
MSEDPTPYGNHSEITELRLQLHREKSRADAFEAAMSKAVLSVIKEAATPRTVDGATAEMWQLRSDNWQKLYAKTDAALRDHQSFLKYEGYEAAFKTWYDWRYQNTPPTPPIQ